MIVAPSTDLTVVREQAIHAYKKLNDRRKIYAAGPSMTNQYVDDMYLHSVHGKSGHHAIFMEITDQSSASQFLKAMTKSHDFGLDLIVVTRCFGNAKREIMEQINGLGNNESAIRLLDRLLVIFPTF